MLGGDDYLNTSLILEAQSTGASRLKPFRTPRPSSNGGLGRSNVKAAHCIVEWQTLATNLEHQTPPGVRTDGFGELGATATWNLLL